METAGLRVLEQWVHDHRTSWERKFDLLGEMLAQDDESG
jgi:hypothetical protein